MRVAVYPGSFDPVTLGHIDIIQRTSKMFDKVIIGVLKNRSKSPLFTAEERVELLKEVTADIPNVEVQSFQGLLIDFVRQNQAENGAIWIPQEVKYKALYFISERLVILIDRNKIVNTMYDAYRELDGQDYKFGTFISGPSKTADIEQALVMGAHGAREVLVILT